VERNEAHEIAASNSALGRKLGMWLTNNPQLRFQDIRHELVRTYSYGDGFQLSLTDPVAVAYKEPLPGVPGGGSHRVVTADGACHYVPYGWRALSWVAKPGAPRASF
jgi:hypothetical protein